MERGIPNLDCATADELEEYRATFVLLAEYASIKTAAMEARVNGHIDLATKFENQLDDLYIKLPEWVSW